MTYVFADCELDTRLYTLRRAGLVFHLRPKVFQVFLYLLDHGDRVVSKQELIEHAWPGQFISEATLEGCIKQMRQALGDSGRVQRVLQTLHGHGYRIITPVETLPAAPPNPEPTVGVFTPSKATPNDYPSALQDPAVAVLEPTAPLAPPLRVEPRRCAACQHANSVGAAFCVACGARLVQPCTRCGQQVPLPAAFCSACGHPLLTSSGSTTLSTPETEALHAEGTQRVPRPETFPGERKLVTILCGTLGNAPGRAKRLGPDALQDEMQALYAVARREIQRYGGTLQHFTGDRFTAVFGVPVAQEDHAQRGVLAALGLQQRLGERQSDGETTEEALTLCLGLHTGPVAVGGMEDAPDLATVLVGDTALLALALQSMAEPGMLLCSDATVQLVQSTAQVEALGPIRLAEHVPAVRVYKVLGRAPQRSPVMPRGERSFSPFVGRGRELAALQALLAQVEDGRGQIVGVVGDPGIGKSRLVYEFRHSLMQRRLTYLVARCFSYRSETPYAPVLDLLRHYCGITDRDRPETIAAHIPRSLQEAGLQPDEWAPPLLQLLGVQVGTERLEGLLPEALKGRMFAALVQMCLNASQQQPLLLEIEDLHWIDATSEEWLATLVERVAGAPIMILVTYRPGYRPAWMDKSYATQITLPRLASHDSRQVMQSVLQATTVAEPLMQQLVLKADGNPFFLEELAWTVREHDEARLLATVPDTIQAVLAARIDRLPPVAKHLLQVAAVIGKDVSAPLLQAVAALPASALHDSLRHLQTAELLYETHFSPDVVYTFKHILIQDVAYQSLLKSTRQHYHQQVARQLLERFPALATTSPELLAHHYTAAGFSIEAIDHWQQAAQRAIERSAHAEAISHLTKGLEELKSLRDTPARAQRELELQTALGPALMALKGYASPEVAHVYARARELCQQVGEAAQLFPVLWGLWRFYLVRAEMQTARELGEQLVSLGQRVQDPSLLLWSHSVLGMTLYFVGEVVAARDHFTRGWALYDPEQHRTLAFRYGTDAGVACLCYGACALWVLGYPDQALQWSRQALTLARQLGHPFSLVTALHYAAVLHQYRQDVQEVHTCLETSLALCTEQGFAHWAERGAFLRGWVLTMQGRKESGIAQMHQSIAARTTAAQVGRPWHLALLSEAYGGMGQPEAGLPCVAEAFEAVHRSGECIYEAELYRLKGELLWQSNVRGVAVERARSHLAEAEACFQHALDIARCQQAKSFELRVAVSLSRLWQHQGKSRAARQLLTQVYDWFTEGLNTADLQEAQALLKALTA